MHKYLNHRHDETLKERSFGYTKLTQGGERAGFAREVSAAGWREGKAVG